MRITGNANEIFHIHTKRCGHAAGEDREYIETAIQQGFHAITFTDHAPFPGDPFQNRMRYVELGEYLRSLGELKEEYRGIIDVRIGLEAEYFPQYDGYYESLCNMKQLDAGLILGQHIYYDDEKGYSFDFHMSGKEEMKGLYNAVVSGIRSGYFQCVAHPDRIFCHIEGWDKECTEASEGIIHAAMSAGIPLEFNIRSVQKGLCREEFWSIAKYSNVNVRIGADAHSIKDVEEHRQYYTQAQRMLAR